jgi:peptidyl-prolyl cis-trans isomerase-like 4
MSVLLETSKGDIVVDLFTEDCPQACLNFLKLCKAKYYHGCVFHSVQRGFLVQTGDPTATGRGGDSVFGALYGPQARCFADELRPHLRHRRRGMLGMASAGPDANASQFYITTGAELASLDDRHTLFGEVAEGWEALEAIDAAPVDAGGRPLQNIRVRRTHVLEDPFPDPPGLAALIPEGSPLPPAAGEDGRLEDDWAPADDARAPAEAEAAARDREARERAVVLEMIGDLPEADAAPPATMLFVCKLNPVTTEEDLEIIFGRFGRVASCDLVRDARTGESLCYGFLGFDSEAACEAAYFKMNNVLIDDRRIRVDFSQSVSHIWKQFKVKGKGGGDARLGAEAAGHVRGGGAHGGLQLELKAHLRPGGGGGGGAPRGGGGGGGAYGLLLDEPAAPASAPAAALAPARGREEAAPCERERERERGRERSRERGREGKADRSRRSRSRDRERRRRSRSRDRRRRCSRSRERRRSRSRERHRR